MKSRVASGAGPALWKTAFEQGLAVYADLDGAEVSADRLLVDAHAEAGTSGAATSPFRSQRRWLAVIRDATVH
jgi:hypothetical protein